MKQLRRSERHHAGATSTRGSLVFYRATGVTNVQLGDPKVVEATLLKGGRLQLRAKQPGQTDLVAFNEKTEIARLAVSVAGPQAETGFQLSAVGLKVGESVALSIAGLTAATSRTAKLVEATVSTPGALLLKARGAGDTVIELTIDGAPQTLVVKISAR